MCFSNTCTVVIFWKQCKLLLWNTNRILYSSWMQCNKLLCCWCRLRAFKGMEILVASVLKSIPGVVLCSAHNKWQMALGDDTCTKPGHFYYTFSVLSHPKSHENLCIAKGRSVWLFMWPSVTLVIHAYTVQDIKILFIQYGRAMFQVPWCQIL